MNYLKEVQVWPGYNDNKTEQFKSVESHTCVCWESHKLWQFSVFQFPIKALVNEDTLLRTHCCPWRFLGCANWETFVADTKCFWTKSETFFVSRTQNLCPQQMLRSRANGETFVSATMCPQQCVLVCQGLNSPCLHPRFCINSCCEMHLGICRPSMSISQ